MSESDPTLEDLRAFAREYLDPDPAVDAPAILFSNKYTEEVADGVIHPGERVVRVVGYSDRRELLDDRMVETVQHPYDAEGRMFVTSVATLFTRYNRIPTTPVVGQEQEVVDQLVEDGHVLPVPTGGAPEPVEVDLPEDAPREGDTWITGSAIS